MRESPTPITKQITFAALLAMPIMLPLEATASLLEGPFYYVRPALRVGPGELIDGLQENGPVTSSISQGVTGTSRSAVSLTDGTVKMFASESITSNVGLQTFGGFGERLDIRGGAGTNWDISFGVEGTIDADLGFAAPGGTPATFRYNVGLVVHQAGVATGLNFLGIANDPCFGQDPLSCDPAPPAVVNLLDEVFIEVPVEDFPAIDNFFENAFASVSASIPLLTNSEQFDVFAYTNVQLFSDTAGIDSGIVRYTLDFENTATYSQQLGTGVEAFSSSGQFLGLSTPPTVDNPVSVPAPGALFLIATGLIPIFRRRRC